MLLSTYNINHPIKIGFPSVFLSLSLSFFQSSCLWSHFPCILEGRTMDLHVYLSKVNIFKTIQVGSFYLQVCLLTTEFPKTVHSNPVSECVFWGLVRSRVGRDGTMCAQMCLVNSVGSHKTHYKHISFKKYFRKEPCLTLITKFPNHT